MKRIAEALKSGSGGGSLWEPRESDLPSPGDVRREPRLAGLRECAPFRIMLMRTRRLSRFAMSMNGVVGIAFLALLVTPFAGKASLPVAALCYLLAVLATVALPTFVTYSRLRALLPDACLPDLALTSTPPEEIARGYWGAILYPPLMRQRAIASWIWFALFAAIILTNPADPDSFWIAAPGLFCSSGCIVLSLFSPWHTLSFCAGALERQRKWGEQRGARRPAWALTLNLARIVANFGWNVGLLLGLSLIPSAIYVAALGYAMEEQDFRFDVAQSFGAGGVAILAGAALGFARGISMRRGAAAHLASMSESVAALVRLRLERMIGATEACPANEAAPPAPAASPPPAEEGAPA